MRILILHRLVAEFGGAHRYLLHLVDLLESMHWDVHLALNGSEDNVALVNSIKSKGIPVYDVDFDEQLPALVGRAIDSIIENVEPDVIDFEAAAKTIVSAALSSVRLSESRAIKVLTMHLPLVSDQSSLHRWVRNIPLSFEWRSLRERRKFVAIFDKGLSVSGLHAATMRELFGLPVGFFTVIPNGVDVDIFKPREKLAPPERKPIKILACGGLSRQKRYDLLIAAAGRLRASGNEFEILIAGEGPLKADLRKSLVDHGVRENVRLIGHVNDMPSFFAQADIFVMCSDSEGLPFAALEAMATGLPSVVTEAGELPKVIRHGKEGLVVGCGDHVAIANALRVLITDAEMRKAFGCAARKRVEQEFNTNDTRQRLSEFYCSIETR